ncbi:hypothetical protein KJ972_01635, partial [Candidatus Micrarchaeota archaeon]|nr:hypothetical protein [Candidatus Micrarchaeota archaeon]
MILGLKSLYYGIEDKYYRLLDKIQDHIPIYKVVDPIDKVFPSFILFTIIIVLIITGIAFFLLNIEPTEYNAYIKVVDADNQALENVTISLTMGEETLELVTNDRGAATIALNQQQASATVSINADGFVQVSDYAVELAADHTVKIQLEIDIAEFETTFVVRIEDSVENTLIDDITIVVSFVCQHTPDAPGQKFVSSGQFVVNKDASCGTLYADFVPQGAYEEKRNVAILTSPQTVELDSLDSEPELGHIEVTVEDSNNTGVPNVNIQYWSGISSGNPIAGGTTDAQGKVRIEDLLVGFYGVSAFAPDGRSAEQTNIEVQQDQTQYVTLSLPDLLNGKKIFLKLVDANSLQPLQGISIRLYNNTSKVGNTATTTSQGTFERMVDDTTSSNFSAVFTHASYLLKFEDLVPMDANENQPTQIELDKALRDETDVPLNYGIAVVKTMNEKQEPVANVDVEFFRNDYANPLYITVTGTDANVDIHNLYPTAPGKSYFAKAYSSEHDSNGISDSRTLAVGESKTFPVILYTGRGTFEITVVDFENPIDKISGADITAFEWDPVTETKEILDQGQTDAIGVWESIPIKTNKTVRFEVGAPGWKRYSSSPFVFSYRDQVIEETFKLSRLMTFPGDSCSSDTDCSFPQSCNAEGVCELECTDSSDCVSLGGYYCGPDNTCELAPENYCDDSIPCSVSCNQCESNQCVEPIGESCSSGADCCGVACDLIAEPWVCYNPNGDSCTTDLDCGDDDFICTSCGSDEFGQPIKCCRKECTYPNHTECPIGMVCDVSGICTEPTPVNSIQLVFEEIRGADAQDPIHPPILEQGKTYSAIFRLQLSMEENWQDIEMHYRMGPDTDPSGTDQNVFILNIDSIVGAEVSNFYPVFSSETDLSEVYDSPNPVEGSSKTARQVNMKYEGLETQSDHTIVVTFKIKNIVPLGTPVPLHFQARGYHNGYLFNTESHTQVLAIGSPLCNPTCDPFLWSFHLNDATGPSIEPENSMALSENTEYSIYYALWNTTTQDFMNAELQITTPDPIMSITDPLAFTGQTLPGQSRFDWGMNNPFDFSTNTTTLGTVGHLNYSLSVPSVSDSSTQKSLVFLVEPQNSLVLEFIPLGGEPVEEFMTTVKAMNGEGQLVPIEGALVRVATNYDGDDWQDPTVNLDWDFDCTTNDLGLCLFEGIT